MKKYKLVLSLFILFIVFHNLLLAQWELLDTPVWPNPTGFCEGDYTGEPVSNSRLYWAYSVSTSPTAADGYFKIFKSIDAGNSWSTVVYRDYLSAGIYEINFISDDTGFYVRNDISQELIERTSNGLQNSTLTFGSPGFPNYYDLHMESYDKMYAIHFTKQFLMLENDTFKVVSAFNANLIFSYSEIETTPDESIYVTCGSNLLNSNRSYMILKSQNFGLSWDTVFSDTNSSILAIKFISNNLGIGVGHNGLVIKTEDAGNTWTVGQSFTTKDLFALDCLNDSSWIAVGQSGTIITSYDRGLNWNSIESPTDQKLIKVKWPDTTGYIFVQSSNQMWRANVDVITNIDSEPEIEEHLSIYPNPAQQVVNIAADGYEIDEVNIYSIKGRKLLGQRPTHNSVNISTLQQGIYILEVVIEKRKIRQKLLVQR